MESELQNILEKVFTVSENKIIIEMLEVVNRNISDSKRTKRVNALNEIIRGVGNDRV